jgi:hypothetical protein
MAQDGGVRSGIRLWSKSASRLVRGNLASLTSRIRRRASRSSHSAVSTSAVDASGSSRAAVRLHCVQGHTGSAGPGGQQVFTGPTLSMINNTIVGAK